MTAAKLTTALTRMATRSPGASIAMIQRLGRTIRSTPITVEAATILTANRSDFVGHGTGRNVRSIEHVPVSPSSNWQPCWRNTQAACLPFHADQRSPR